jgi:hypothetical protein
MEVIKRKIYLEDGIDRKDNSSTWGKLTATNFYIKVLLVQNYDDMGILLIWVIFLKKRVILVLLGFN